MTFAAPDLAALAANEEIDVETRAADGTVHRTTVWPVVHGGVAYLRSYKGASGRWYREATADSSIALIVDGRRIPATAILADDPVSIEACSAGLRAKYADSYSLAAMLADAVLSTTLRVVPA